MACADVMVAHPASYMGCCLEGYRIMEIRKAESIGLVHLYIHIQHSRNPADNLSSILPKIKGKKEEAKIIWAESRIFSLYSFGF